MAARIEKIVTSGTFSLDGGTWDVDNNVWIVGDDQEVIVFDAPHDAQAIADHIGERTVKAIVCTHAHDDHVRKADELRQLTGAPIWLAPEEAPLWDLVYGEDGPRPDQDVTDGTEITVAGTTLRAIHTPGHSPGGMCWYAEDLGVLFSGDTLFDGGPGATGRSFSDRPTLEASISRALFDLPGDTVVHTGHGTDTTIEAERDRSAEW
ncbi:MBL fold metallo-hydrolase [Actinomycetota bacterium]